MVAEPPDIVILPLFMVPFVISDAFILRLVTAVLVLPLLVTPPVALENVTDGEVLSNVQEKVLEILGFPEGLVNAPAPTVTVYVTPLVFALDIVTIE